MQMYVIKIVFTQRGMKLEVRARIFYMKNVSLPNLYPDTEGMDIYKNFINKGMVASNVN